MGILWFNTFVLLSLLMRKLRYPIKFSAMPLLLLLFLSTLRMFLVIEIPGTIPVFSEVILPAVIVFLRYTVIPYEVLGVAVSALHISIFIWATVAVILLTRYVLRYWVAYWTALSLNYAPDEEAEAILAEIAGPISCPKKRGRVFRTPIKVPFTVGIKPYIYLPDGVAFTPDELRTVLRHEWKHIQGKDYLIEFMMRFINYVFWWNPLTYILRRNVSFALELRCDYFAVGASGSDYQHYKSALGRISGTKRKEIIGNTLVNSENVFLDRHKTLELRMKDRTHKRALTTICFYFLVAILFLLSYTFIILPAHWESSYEHVACIEYPPGYYYSEEAFRAEENFLVDNGDGTFSLYIDGRHVENRYADDIPQDIFTFLPIRTSED